VDSEVWAIGLEKNTGAALDITGALDISTLFNLSPYCQMTYSYTVNGEASVETTHADGLPEIDSTSSSFNDTQHTIVLTATPFTGSADAGSKTIEVTVGCLTPDTITWAKAVTSPDSVSTYESGLKILLPPVPSS